MKTRSLISQLLAPAMGLILVTGAVPQAMHAQARSAAVSSINVAFVIDDGADPFYLTMKCGAFAAAKASTVNLTWQGPAAIDFQPELQTLNAVMQRHPQGLVLAPFDPNAFIQPVKQAMKAGIPVVTVDGSLSAKVEVQNIRTNNIAAGKLAADALAKAIGGQGKVLIVALSPGVVANTERATGFANEIKAKYPKISLLPIQFPGGDSNKASQDVSAAIQAHSDLKGVYTTYAIASNAAASAILAAGKRGQIKLVAYDADPNEVRQLKSGTFDALVVQNPYQEGFDSVTLVAKLVRHQISAGAVKYQAYPTSYIATRENINAPWLQKYLYKVSC